MDINLTFHDIEAFETSFNDCIIALYDIYINKENKSELNFTYHVYESLPYIALTALVLGYNKDDINGIFNDNDINNETYPLLYRKIYNDPFIDSKSKEKLKGLFELFLGKCNIYNSHRNLVPIESIYYKESQEISYMKDNEVLETLNDFIFKLYKPNVIINQLAVINEFLLDLPLPIMINKNLNYNARTPDQTLLWILFFMLKIEQFINDTNLENLDNDTESQKYIYSFIDATKNAINTQIRLNVISDAKLFINKYNSLSEDLYKILFQFNYILNIHKSLLSSIAKLANFNSINTLSDLILAIKVIKNNKESPINLFMPAFGGLIPSSNLGFTLFLNKISTKTDYTFLDFRLSNLKNKVNETFYYNKEPYVLPATFLADIENKFTLSTLNGNDLNNNNKYLLNSFLTNYIFKFITTYNISETFTFNNKIIDLISIEVNKLITSSEVKKIKLDFYYNTSDSKVSCSTSDIYVNMTFLTSDKSISFNDLIYNVISKYKVISKTYIDNELNKYTPINCADSTGIIMPATFLNSKIPPTITQSGVYILEAFIGSAIYSYANKITNILAFQTKEKTKVPVLGISVPYEQRTNKAKKLIDLTLKHNENISNISFLPSVSKIEFIEANVGSIPIKMEGMTDYIYQNLGTPAQGIKIYFHIANDNDIIDVLTLFSQLSPIDNKYSYTSELSSTLLTQIQGTQTVTLDTLYNTASQTSKKTNYTILSDLSDAYRKDTADLRNINLTISNPIINSVGIYSGTVSQMQIQAIEGTSACELIISILPTKYDYASGSIVKESKSYDVDDHIAMLYASSLFSTEYPDANIAKWYMKYINATDLKYINLATQFSDNMIGELLVLFSICEFFMDISNSIMVGTTINAFDKVPQLDNNQYQSQLATLTGNIFNIVGNVIQDAIASISATGSASMIGSVGKCVLIQAIGSLFNVAASIVQSNTLNVVKGDENINYLAIPLDTIILTGLPRVIHKLYHTMVAKFGIENNKLVIPTQEERVAIFFNLLNNEYSVVLRTLFSLGFSVENVVANKALINNISLGGSESERYTWMIDLVNIVEQNNVFTQYALTNMPIDDKVKYVLSKLKYANHVNLGDNSTPPLKLCIYPPVTIASYDNHEKLIEQISKYFSKDNSDNIKEFIKTNRAFKYVSAYLTSYKDSNSTSRGLNNIYVAARTLLYNVEHISKLANIFVAALELDSILYDDILVFSYIFNNKADIFTSKDSNNDVKEAIIKQMVSDDKDYINRMQIMIGGDKIHDMIKGINVYNNNNFNVNSTITVDGRKLRIDEYIFNHTSNNINIGFFTEVSTAIFRTFGPNTKLGKKDINKFFGTIPTKNIALFYIDRLLNTDFYNIAFENGGSKPKQFLSIAYTMVSLAGLSLVILGIISGATMGIGLVIIMLLSYQAIRIIKRTISSLSMVAQSLEEAMNNTSRLTFSLILYSQLKYNTGLIYYLIFSNNVLDYTTPASLEITLKLQAINNYMQQKLIASIFSVQMKMLPCSVSPIFYGHVSNKNKFAIFNSTVLFTNEFALKNKQIRTMMKAIMLSNMELKSESKQTIINNYFGSISQQLYKFLENLITFKNSLLDYLQDKTNIPEINNIYNEFFKWQPNFDSITNTNVNLDNISDGINLIQSAYTVLDNYSKTKENDYDDKLVDVFKKYYSVVADIEAIETIMADASDEKLSNYDNSDNYIAVNKFIDSNIVQIKDSMYSNSGIYGTSSYAKMAGFMDDFSFDKVDYMGFNPAVDSVYYKIYLIKETKNEYLLYDGIYSYNSVISMDIVKHDREPIRTMKLVLNNPFKTLNNANTTKITQSGNVKVISNDSYASIYLQPGATIKVLISRNLIAPNYNTEFVGEIVEIQGNNPLTIIAQSSAGAMLDTKYHVDDVYKYKIRDDVFITENVIYNLLCKILYEIDKYGKLSEYNYLDIGGIYVDSSAVQFMQTNATKKTLIEKISDSIKELILNINPVINEADKTYDIVSKKSNILENIKVQSEYSMNTWKKFSNLFRKIFKTSKVPSYFLSYNTTPYEDIKKIVMRTQNNTIAVRPYDERETIYIGPLNGYYKYTNKYDVLNYKVTRAVSMLDAYAISGARLKTGEIDIGKSDDNIFDIFASETNKVNNNKSAMVNYIFTIVNNLDSLPIDIKKEALYIICDFFDSFMNIIANNTIHMNSATGNKTIEMNLFSDLAKIFQNPDTSIRNNYINLYVTCTLIFGLPENIETLLINFNDANKKYFEILPKAAATYYYLWITNNNGVTYDASLTNIVNVLLGKNSDNDMPINTTFNFSIDDILILFALNLLDFKSRASVVFPTKEKADNNYFLNKDNRKEYDEVISMLASNYTSLYEHIKSLDLKLINGIGTLITNIKDNNNGIYVNSSGIYANINSSNRINKSAALYTSTLLYEYVDVIMNELYSMFLKASPSHRPIRQCHILMSKLNIIANNIQLARGPNKISLVYDGNYDSNKVKLNNIGNAPNQTKILDLPFSKSLPEQLLLTNTINAGPVEGVIFPALKGQKYTYQVEPKLVALAYGKETIEDYYSGNIIVLGKNYEPGDICYLYDEMNDLYGYFKIKDVTTSYSIDAGYISTLTPAVIVMEKNQDVNNKVMTFAADLDKAISVTGTFLLVSNIYAMAYSLLHNFSPASFNKTKPSVMTKIAGSMDALGVTSNIFETSVKFIKTGVQVLFNVFIRSPAKLPEFTANLINTYKMTYNTNMNLRYTSYKFLDDQTLATKTYAKNYTNKVLSSLATNSKKTIDEKIINDISEAVMNKFTEKTLKTFYSTVNKHIQNNDYKSIDDIFGAYKDQKTLNNVIDSIIDEVAMNNLDFINIFDNPAQTLNSALNKTGKDTSRLFTEFNKTAGNNGGADAINTSKESISQFYTNVEMAANEADANTTIFKKEMDILFGDVNKPLSNTVFKMVNDGNTRMLESTVEFLVNKAIKGVGIISGAYIIKETINQAFVGIATQLNKNDLSSPYIINGLFYKNMPFMANLDGMIADEFITEQEKFIASLKDEMFTFIYNLNKDINNTITATNEEIEELTQ